MADVEIPEDDDDDDGPANDDARALSPEDKARQTALAQFLSIHRALTDEEVLILRRMFPLILRAHFKRLWKRLRRRGLTPDDAKEVLQETFLAAFEEIRSGGFQPLTAQLNRILLGKLLNFLKAKKRCPLSVGLPSSGSEPLPKTGPEAVITRLIDRIRDREDLCVRLRAVLSDKLFAVVELRLLNDLPVVEVADVLGINEDAVHARLSRAKRRLYELAYLWVPPSKMHMVK